MNEHSELDTKEELLIYEVPDAALEIAAGTPRDRPVSMTISFCSGLDYCPPQSPHA